MHRMNAITSNPYFVCVCGCACACVHVWGGWLHAGRFNLSMLQHCFLIPYMVPNHQDDQRSITTPSTRCMNFIFLHTQIKHKTLDYELNSK